MVTLGSGRCAVIVAEPAAALGGHMSASSSTPASVCPGALLGVAWERVVLLAIR